MQLAFPSPQTKFLFLMEGVQAAGGAEKGPRKGKGACPRCPTGACRADSDSVEIVSEAERVPEEALAIPAGSGHGIWA